MWAARVVKRLASLPFDDDMLQLHPLLISHFFQVLIVRQVGSVSEGPERLLQGISMRVRKDSSESSPRILPTPCRLYLFNVCIVDFVQDAVVWQKVAPPQRCSSVRVEVEGIALQICEGGGLSIVHLEKTGSICRSA